ncbi:hypothetical protein PQX77_004433 [Marasmius sp. AFHP31]|nr:hypothetical protein PQX77_004433 [Marasmius sp. AFHP31]
MSYPGHDRKTRSGRVWASYIKTPDQDAIFPIQLSEEVDSTVLLKEAYGREVEDEGEDGVSFVAPPAAESARQGSERKRKHEGEKDEDDQRKDNQRRRVKRQKKVAEFGHPSGRGRAFEKTVLPAVPFTTNFDSTALPFAKGAWIGKPPSRIPNAKDRVTLDDLDAERFGYIAWNGRTSVPILDKDGRVLVTLLGRPSDASYPEATERAAGKILQRREEVNWKAEEILHERGEGFPAVAYGISYGKGQPEPMRLGGPRYHVMEELVADPDIGR